MRSQQFLAGMKKALPIVLGYLPLGLAYGVLAREAGLSIAETVLMSIIVYAGSAQFIAISLLSAGASGPTIVFTTFLVNLRHLLMSASLVPYLQHFSQKLLAIISFEITDETYAVAMSHFRNHRPDSAFYLGLHLTSHLSWVTSSFLGGAFGVILKEPEKFGLNFALPAMFIALLIMQIKHRRDWIIAVIAGGLALTFAKLVPGNWYIILATVLAATLGVLLERWKLD